MIGKFTFYNSPKPGEFAKSKKGKNRFVMADTPHLPVEGEVWNVKIEGRYLRPLSPVVTPLFEGDFYLVASRTSFGFINISPEESDVFIYASNKEKGEEEPSRASHKVPRFEENLCVDLHIYFDVPEVEKTEFTTFTILRVIGNKVEIADTWDGERSKPDARLRVDRSVDRISYTIGDTILIRRHLAAVI